MTPLMHIIDNGSLSKPNVTINSDEKECDQCLSIVKGSSKPVTYYVASEIGYGILCE